jgi:hypothetical protein
LQIHAPPPLSLSLSQLFLSQLGPRGLGLDLGMLRSLAVVLALACSCATLGRALLLNGLAQLQATAAEGT